VRQLQKTVWTKAEKQYTDDGSPGQVCRGYTALAFTGQVIHESCVHMVEEDIRLTLRQCPVCVTMGHVNTFFEEWQCGRHMHDASFC
jgi:hypothetical protein